MPTREDVRNNTDEYKAYHRAYNLRSYHRIQQRCAETAALADITMAEAKIVHRTIQETIKQALLRGETVKIPGFGKFVPVSVPPRLRGLYLYPAHKTVRFYPFKALRYCVNPGDFY